MGDEIKVYQGTVEAVQTMATENRELLIEIAGRTGKNGKIGELEKDSADHGSRIASLERAAWKSGAGAMAGGGVVAGLIEVIRRLAG